MGSVNTHGTELPLHVRLLGHTADCVLSFFLSFFFPRLLLSSCGVVSTLPSVTSAEYTPLQNLTFHYLYF